MRLWRRVCDTLEQAGSRMTQASQHASNLPATVATELIIREFMS